MAADSSANSLWWVAARSGVMAAVAGCATAVIVSVLCWLPDAGVSGQPSAAIRAGLLSFLAAHHGGITVNGVPAGFLPLALLLIVVAFAVRAGTAIAELLDDGQDMAPGRLLAALLLATVSYCAVCELLVPLSRVGRSHVPATATGAAAFIVFILAAGASLARRTSLFAPLIANLPDVVPAAARGALAATAVYLAAGALLTGGSLIVHVHRVTELSRQVGGGFSGLPVLLIGLACAPNAAVAGGAYLAGPGFAIGSGTTVNAFSTSHGLLPALPLLGAVPDGNGANPIVLAVMCLVALAAAACVARCVRQIGPVGFVRHAGGALVSGLGCGIAMAVASWLAGGAAGSGRLRVVGASPWQVGVAVSVTVGVLAVLVVCALTGWDLIVRRNGSGAGSEPISARALAGSGVR